jgi:alginate O-acetyltransferase complex protein AlgI
MYFYFVGEKEYVLVLAGSAVVDYTIGSKIHANLHDKAKALFYLKFSIVANLGFLFLFKYADFFVEQVNNISSLVGHPTHFPLPHMHLPLGISFFTFQTLSYSIDVYRRKVPASHNFPEFLMYVTMFPQLVAGPIVRYIHVIDQLGKKQFALYEGVERFVIGLAKKVIIADSAAYYADLFFNANPNHISGAGAWAGALAYTVQIYFDFSGYSDMAIGLGRILGFRFPENFNHPYRAVSLQDFWRRWHISLSTWFRDYLYIPLGGNRKGPVRAYINQIIVFLLCGLWHGASWNFVFWGMYHGLIMSAEKFFKVEGGLFKYSFINRLLTIFIVLIGWVYFRALDMNHANIYLSHMFNMKVIDVVDFMALPTDFFYVLILGFIFSSATPFLLFAQKSRGFRTIALVILFVVCIGLLSVQSFSPFIYFRF